VNQMPCSLDGNRAGHIIRTVARRLSSAVFIGRSEELTTLLSAADVAASGEASLALVGGEAGVGKSRLVTEVGARLRDRGWLVLEGGSVALGDDGLPFGPIVEALRALVRAVDADRIAAAAGPHLPDLVRLVPELSPTSDTVPLPEGQAEWLQVRIFEGVLRLLGRLGESTPALLVVEDLHWADRSTRDLLSFLTRNLRDQRLLIIGTFRSDELHRRHPLTSWLAEAERQPRVERIDLARFDRDELIEMLTAIAGAPPQTSTVDSIARRSDGNAFFAEELVAAVGDTDQRDELPETLRGVLLVRLSATSEAARRLIEIAAVAGRQVEHAVLADVCGLPDVEMRAALHEAVDAQLLVVDRTEELERFQFRHALMQEAAYDELLPSELRTLHATYARAIEARPVGGGATAASRLVEISHHWSAANDSRRAMVGAIVAGDASWDVHAYAEAARQYERAIGLWDVVPAEDRPRERDLGDLHDAASAAATAIGDASRAVGLARRAVELIDGAAGPDGDLERRARARERYATASALAGDEATSLRLLQEAVELLENAPPSVGHARALAGRARQLSQVGRSAEALVLAERAIESARSIGHQGIESRAMRTMGTVIAEGGNLGGGIELLRQSLALAGHDDDPTEMHTGYNVLSGVLDGAGRVEESVEIALAGAESIRRYGGELSFLTFLEDNAAEGLIQLGRYPEAAELLDRHLTHVRPGRAMHLHFTLAHLALRTGDLRAARHHVEIARSAMGTSPDAHMVFDLHAFGSEIALWGGDPAAALAIARDGFEAAVQWDDAALPSHLAIPAMHAAADLAVRERAARNEAGAGAAARAARDMIERFRASSSGRAEPDALYVHEIEWKMALCQAELGRATGEDDPANWEAVRPAVAERPAPFLEAYVLWRKAEALAARGETAAAAQPLREAHSIAVRIGARLLVAGIEGLGRRLRVELAEPDAVSGDSVAASPVARADPFGLSGREREVLALVAEGYTNRRIGETLFISESTAGVHVSHILGKLGVGSRTEAAAVAIRLRLDREADPSQAAIADEVERSPVQPKTNPVRAAGAR